MANRPQQNIFLVLLVCGVVLSESCLAPRTKDTVAPDWDDVNSHSSSARTRVLSELTPADIKCAAIRRQYEACTNRHEKLSFVVSLFDKYDVRVGTRLESLRAILGTDLEDYGVRNGVGRARIVMADWIDDPKGFAPSFRVGWYAAVYYTEEGLVEKYFLSNLWDDPHMWGW